MALILILDLLVIVCLTAFAYARGFEQVLPLAAFLFLLFPLESQLQIPGLFDLTTQRVIVLTLLFLFLVLRPNNRSAQPSTAVPMASLLIVFNLWMLFSSARSVVPMISFKATLSQCLDFCILYVIYAKTVTTTETVEKIMTGFVAGAFLCCVVGVPEIYGDWRITSLFPSIHTRFSNPDGWSDRGARLQSTFAHPILLGAALALAVPMAIYLLTLARSPLRKAWLSVAVLVMLFCIYKTGSRGPWLALGSSLVLLLALGRAAVRKYVVVLLLLSATVLVVRPGIWDTIANLYGATKDADSPQGQSYQWRYVVLKVAKRELSKDLGRSIWGFGPESFYYLGLTADMEMDGENHTVAVDTCDSAIAEILMETGVVGLILVVGILLLPTVNSLRSYLSLPDSQRSYYLVLFANLGAFCFLMTNVELFGWGQQSYMLWVILALAMIHPRLSGAELELTQVAS